MEELPYLHCAHCSLDVSRSFPLCGGQSTPFLPSSCPVYACCLAVLAIHMGERESARCPFACGDIVSWESRAGWSGGRRGEPYSLPDGRQGAAGTAERGGKEHCSTLSTFWPSQVYHWGVTASPNPLLSKSSSELSTGLIPAILSPREASEKGYCVSSHRRISGHSVKLFGAGLRQWKGGSCCTHWTFAAPFSRVMLVWEDQQAAPDCWCWEEKSVGLLSRERTEG